MSTPKKEYQHYQCDPNWAQTTGYNSQCRGITTWNLNNQYTIPPLAPNGTIELTFTCTVPRCYSSGNTIYGESIQGRDSCIIVYNAYPDKTTPKDEEIELKYRLNNGTIDEKLCCISREEKHGGTQAFDLAFIRPATLYNDMGLNTLKITNAGESTVHIDHFKIYRIYQMCNIAKVNYDSMCAISGVCEPGTVAGASGNLDSSRIDKPCNYSTAGGLSFTQYHDTSHTLTILGPTQTCSWTFNFNNNTINNGYTGNYTGESICLFNFNKIYTCSGTASSLDVAAEAYLNGNKINTYYLSKLPTDLHGMFPSHDLATSPYYNAYGPNTVTLKNASSATIQMSENDGIDIYRIFKTGEIYSPPCLGGCQTFCQASCQASCQGCQGCQTCYGCQNGCQFFCVTCDACYSFCQACQGGCDATCQACQTTCQYCQNGCQDCQGGCQGCQQSCEVMCQTVCESCASCYQDCYNVCYEYTNRNNNPQTNNNTPTTNTTQNNDTTQTPQTNINTTNNQTTTTQPDTNNNNTIQQQNPTITINTQPLNQTQTQQQTTPTTNTQNQNHIRQNSNFNVAPITEEHIKEILLETLIELGLITQPPTRRQITNDNQ
ncbi:MAG: hypothetical protein FWB84_03780 [Candidatus Bathyarchaeota archaeon]|uniref:hypothetical protein n=1 Tax=Candidatus Bathycorpusculum sp. TaxID=2994959 RepID=UPI002824F175|nr:hypothetical protein [Candidatus Termiticorpusculum sp.]MCL2257719.1 hypothetical protein [Candidatus Termiticorpusculum sp.]MCL2292155.1 hypothetical protein [Candidatus Termiticorpusculum sp.]